MPASEVFYLHLDGEQRGPYTVPQIDHLLNSGLIGEETLYWREGLEQWAPVTSLVAKRERKSPWPRIIAFAAILAVCGGLGLFFGPTVMDGWREVNQRAYTAEAAYWRARDLVRSQALTRGTPVRFAPFDAKDVALEEPRRASVNLHGEIVEPSGQIRSANWAVTLNFDDKRAEWSGARPVEQVQP